MSQPRIALLVSAAAACSFFLGLWLSGGGGRPEAGPRAVSRLLYYACPMHPQYRSGKPGDCLSCGMRLEPVYAGGAATEGGAIPTGLVEVSPARQQILGVRTAPVERGRRRHDLRVLGRVAADERLIYRVNSALDGWIRQVYTDTTGSIVKKNQRLATIYSTMYRSSLQSFLLSLAHLDTARDGLQESPAQVAAVERSVQLARDGLRNLGMGQPQIEEIARTREQTEDLHLYSPATGFVISRNVSVGQRIVNGDKLYEIAELNRVWILADLFERESRYVQSGQVAALTYQGKRSNAKVSEVLPQFDEDSRTLKVRLEMENPDYVLRPGMFVDVEFPLNLPAAMVIPADAVIDSGARQTVFVAKGNGYFEPRAVETGWRLGGQVEVVKGLVVGEQVVVSGNFLLDSESRLRAAAESAGPAKVTDPVCGMEVDPAQAGNLKSAYHGITYYFCADECKRKFDQKPESYLKQTAGPQPN